MTTQLKVSVIIPSYNHKKYIKSSIDSVINQKKDGFTIELIVIDDGSSDGSVELLKQLVTREEYDFELVIKDNEGVCATLNRAIREYSTGDFIAILASDDMWEPTKISKQIKCLEQNPSSELCYAEKTFIGDKVSDSNALTFTGKIKNILTVYPFVPAGTILFTKNLFVKIGGFDETDLRLEDWDFLLRSSHVTEFCCVKEPLLFYRTHDESTIVRMKKDGILFHEKHKVLSKNRNILNPILFNFSIGLHYMSDNVVRRFLGK